MASSPTIGTRQSRVIAASPVYYGWVVVGAAALALAMTLPGQTAGVSLFIDSFIADLGVSRGAISLAYTVATILAAFTLPWTGRWLDRYGPRRGVVVIALLFGLACAGMGLAGGLATLFVGFFLLRSLGPGALALVSLHAVNLWFIQRRGVAVGSMGIGLALATAFALPMIAGGIEVFGWRATYFAMGAVLLLVLLPIGAVLFRGHPERFGLQPDGRAETLAPSVPEPAFTLHEARRTGMFWLLSAGIVCTAAIGTGLLFHHIALMGSGGLSREAAALMFIPYGLVTIPSNLVAGALIDRFGPRRVMVAHLGLFAAMTASIPLVATIPAVIGYGIVFGVTQGLQNNLAGSGFAYYFGRRHVGAIKGYATTLFVGGTALGPPLVALGEHLPGGYTSVLVALALIPTVLMVIALRPTFEQALGRAG
jgi:MFS family permease